MTSAGAAPSRGARVVRHRLTWLAYLGLGLYGFFLYGFGPTTPLVREELGISRTLGGLYGTALAVGAVIAGFAGTAPVRRVGRRTLLWGSAAGLSAGVVLYTLGGSFPVSLLGALVCGTTGSWIVTVANASLMDEQGLAGPAALSEGNAVAAGIGTVAPLVVGGAVALGLGWRAGLLVVVLVAAAVYLAFRSVPIPDGVPVNPADHPDGAHRLPGEYWVTWGVLVCVIAVEFCLSLWAADMLRTRTGLGAAGATAAWSGALAGVFISRLVGGRLAERHPVDTLLFSALTVLLAGFALFWVPTAAGLAVGGLFVCGLGLGLLFPLTMARAIAAAPGRSDLAATRASLAAGVAAGLVPFLLGAAADRFGTHAAFLIVPLLVGLAIVGLLVSRHPAAA